MNHSISTLGWILIIFLILLIVSLNISLFTSMKKKDNYAKDHWIAKLRDTGQLLKDPFQNENKKMKELSEKVEQLQKNQKMMRENIKTQTHSGDNE
jgi:uncharacterized protein YlxW (UPF0749 family)